MHPTEKLPMISEDNLKVFQTRTTNLHFKASTIRIEMRSEDSIVQAFEGMDIVCLKFHAFKVDRADTLHRHKDLD